ncbi:MAG: thermonuclease family protein [Desulfobulbus sp.]
MIHLLKVRIFLSLFLLIFIPSLSLAWQGKVVNVSDGDTIKVLHDGQQVKIRLYGIDCPEKAQAYGQKAREMTTSMVAGRTVDVEVKDTDRYGRSVGLVSIDGVSLNEAMVRNGYAWVYRQYCKELFCSDWIDLESVARQQQKGMWADPHIVPPWDWRHSGGKQLIPNTSLDAGKSKVKSSDVAGGYHGNVRSHKFHRSGCQHYNCKNCTAIFGSREQAVSAGYSPCGICKP